MGNVALFSGQFAKALKGKLNLFDAAYILTGTQDPRSTSTDAPKGSLLLRQTGSGDGEVYQKLDNGSSTNWRLISAISQYTPEVLDIYSQILQDAPYELLTRSVADLDGSTLVSTYGGTAALDNANLAYSFGAAADTLTTVQLLDTTAFLNESKDLWSAQTAVVWKTGYIDTTATYELSRDGGGHYKTVTMDRVSDSNVFVGDYRWLTEEQDESATVTNPNTGLEAQFQAVGNVAWAQMFTAPYDFSGLSLVTKLRKVGSPAGNFRYAIYSDSAGSPDSPLYESAWQSVSATATSATDYSVNIDFEFVSGTDYHFLIETDAAYKADFSSGVRDLRLTLTLTSAGFNQVKRDNGGWFVFAGAYMYFIVNDGVESFATLTSFDTGTANTLLNSTTQQKLSQAFTLSSAGVIKRLTLRLNRAAAAVGFLYAQIIKDNAGVPSTDPADVLSEGTPLSISSLGTGNVNAVILMSTKALPAGTYHVVLSTDAAYKAGTMDLSWLGDTGGATPGRRYNGTTWSALGTAMQFRYLVEGRTLDLRLRITSSMASKLLAWGVLYDLENGNTVGGVKKRQVEYFDSVADNFNEFDITQFTPDPDLLSVYYIEAGQVFKAPAFDVQGNTVIFPVNSFNNGGVPANVTLVFDQNTGDSFDNSDLNALLLAANHLGSTDAGIDRSAPGRGIFLRRPDGTLREIVLNDSDQLEVWSV